MQSFGRHQGSITLSEKGTVAYRSKANESGIVLTENPLKEGMIMSIITLEKDPFHVDLIGLDMEVGITKADTVRPRCKSLSELDEAPGSTYTLSENLCRNFLETFDAHQSIGLMIQDGALFTFINGVNVEVIRSSIFTKEPFRGAVNICGRMRKIKMEMFHLPNDAHFKFLCVKTVNSSSGVLKFGSSVEVCCYAKQDADEIKKAKTAWITVDRMVHDFDCEGQVDTSCLEKVPETINPNDYTTTIQSYTTKSVSSEYSVIRVMCIGPPGSGKAYVKHALLGDSCGQSTQLKNERYPSAIQHSLFGSKASCKEWIYLGHDMQVKQLAMSMKNQLGKCSGSDEQGGHKEKIIMPYLAYKSFQQNPKAAEIGSELSLEHIYYTDCGGQSQFFELLPTFIKCGMVLMVVLKLNEDLSNVPDNYTMLTNLEIIETITSSVSAYKTEQGETEPCLLVVGTNVDGQIAFRIDGKIKKLNGVLNAALTSVHYDCIKKNKQNGDILFPVNTKNDKENTAGVIRDSIKDKVKVSNTPVHWHSFAIHVAAYCEKVQRKVLSFKECIQIGLNREVCIYAENEIEKALKHYDRANFYLYFPTVLPQFIITDTQVLLNWVSELLEISSTKSQLLLSGITPSSQHSLRTKGIVTAPVLHVCMKSFEAPEIDFGIEQLVSLFMHLNVFTQISDNDYFMPNALESCSERNLNSLKQRYISNFDPLLLLPKTRLVPQGFFTSLITHLMNSEEQNKLTWFPAQQQYRNAVAMRYTGGSSGGGLVLLVNSKAWIEVCFAGESPQDAYDIRETVFSSIPGACESLYYDHEKIQFSIGFYCVFNSTKKHNSQKHPCKVDYYAASAALSITCLQNGDSSSKFSTQRRLTSWLFKSDYSSESKIHYDIEELQIQLRQEKEKHKSAQKSFEELQILLEQEKEMRQRKEKDFEELQILLEQEKEMCQRKEKEFNEFRNQVELEQEDQDFEKLQSLLNLEQKELLESCENFHEIKRNSLHLQVLLEQEQHEHHLTKKENQYLQALCAHTENSWIISHKDLQTTNEELGRGGWGVINVGVFGEQRVAVKQLYKVIMSKNTLAIMNREINTMSKLHHPNLLLFIGAALDHPSGNPLIITEVMDTSLRQAYEKGELTEKSTKLSVLNDTASGLNYLHSHPDEIIHRDVSSTNVLLESRGPNKWRAKLAEFWSANITCNTSTQATGAATCIYSAPESVVTLATRKRRQTTKMDVFSYGVLLCEVMACSFPDIDKFHTILQSVYDNSPPVGDLIQTCISENPEDRPAMKQVIQKIDQYMSSGQCAEA